jgi:hypothetical protein
MDLMRRFIYLAFVASSLADVRELFFCFAVSFIIFVTITFLFAAVLTFAFSAYSTGSGSWGLVVFIFR